MNRRSRVAVWLAMLFATATSAIAQTPPVRVGAELDDYVRLLELSGAIRGAPLVFRPWSLLGPVLTDSNHVWASRYSLQDLGSRSKTVTVAPIFPAVEVVYNSTYPRSVNDGVLWSGRGVSGTVTGGASVTWGPLTGILYPTAHFSENMRFDAVEVPFPDRWPFAYQWSDGIDLPHRFGLETVQGVDWGQSSLRLDLGSFTAGYSTENLWWGPAFRNAILMTNSAGGFPHVDVGTGRPVWVGAGSLEVRGIWGELSESEFFDFDPGNDRRYLTGLTVGFQPKFLPGFMVGATRVLYQTWPPGGLAFGEIFDSFSEFFNPGLDTLPDGTVTNDLSDQILSLVAKWVLPDSHFAAFVEWGRGDFAANLRDFVVEPDHSRGYTFGFEKGLPSTDAMVRLRGEFTTLGRSSTFLVRLSPVFYTHDGVQQGYTHKGQMLGAGIGPAANSQFFGVDRYSKGGRWGVYFQRVRFNDDTFFERFDQDTPLAFGLHDVELTLGTSMLRFVQNLDVGASLEVSRRLNWYFQRNHDAWNAKLRFTVGWRENDGGP